MSDARWLEIDAAVASAVHHFSGAATIYDRLRQISDNDDAYMVEMAFMHAMQAGHTSLESALLRILGLFEEEPPTGAQWHADLIRRAVRPVGDRPAILTGAIGDAADETRQFRNVAARAYDNFKAERAREAVASARLLASELAPSISAFRALVDP